MLHITDIFELKAKLNDLKHRLDREARLPQEKELAHKYLSIAIDYVNEIRTF
jgi:heme exporter protein D